MNRKIMQKPLHLKTDRNNSIPLFVQIKNQIIDQIERSVLKENDLLPPEAHIASELGISKIVVRQALCELDKEGYLYRGRGKGTFVKRPRCKRVGIMVRTEGHVHADLFHALVRSFQKHEYLATTLDIAELGGLFNDAIKSPTAIDGIRRVFDSRPDVVVADGLAPLLSLLADYSEIRSGATRLVFVYRWELSRPPDYPYWRVTSDFTAGGCTGVNHLLNMGHKKIIFISPPKPEDPKALSLHSIYQGCLKAFQEHGLDAASSFPVVSYDSSRIEKDLEAILSSPDHPTAAFLYADAYSLPLFRVLTRKGMRVPNDFAIVGYYNTPWTEQVDVPLTSVSVRVDRIAELAAEIGTGAVQREERVFMVAPELVIRESCGFHQK